MAAGHEPGEHAHLRNCPKPDLLEICKKRPRRAHTLLEILAAKRLESRHFEVIDQQPVAAAVIEEPRVSLGHRRSSGDFAKFLHPVHLRPESFGDDELSHVVGAEMPGDVFDGHVARYKLTCRDVGQGHAASARRPEDRPYIVVVPLLEHTV